MGCMPYGPEYAVARDFEHYGFNPSYGLHALRAVNTRQPACWAPGCFNPSYGLHALRAPIELIVLTTEELVSIPHMGCMPYGHMRDSNTTERVGRFQSLIWVACPTGSANGAWRRKAD